jgi:hypothetical protein
MLIYDPNEKFFWHEKSIANDGGQHYSNLGTEPRNLEILLTKGYKTGEVLAHAIGPDTLKPGYSYLKGELAEAYPGKTKSFRRSFVFLNLNNKEVPAAMIVFDHVNAIDKNFKKYWLMHCVEEPVIDGNSTKIKTSEKGYNGQLINSTLLPVFDNLIINKIGGKDGEFSVFGKDYPQVLKFEKNSSDRAAWRIEVSPKEASNADNFLNVMQVMDYDGGKHQPLITEKMEAGKLVGAKIADRIVFFSKCGDLISEPIKITIDRPSKILVTDLVKGNWKITFSSEEKNSSRIIKNEKHLLYFEAGKGTYLLTKL